MLGEFAPKGVDFEKERLLFVMMQAYMDTILTSFMEVFQEFQSEEYFSIAVRGALERAAYQVINGDEEVISAIRARVLAIINSCEGKR
jgi:hypothetical protein